MCAPSPMYSKKCTCKILVRKPFYVPHAAASKHNVDSLYGKANEECLYFCAGSKACTSSHTGRVLADVLHSSHWITNIDDSSHFSVVWTILVLVHGNETIGRRGGCPHGQASGGKPCALPSTDIERLVWPRPSNAWLFACYSTQMQGRNLPLLLMEHQRDTSRTDDRQTEKEAKAAPRTGRPRSLSGDHCCIITPTAAFRRPRIRFSTCAYKYRRRL